MSERYFLRMVSWQQQLPAPSMIDSSTIDVGSLKRSTKLQNQLLQYDRCTSVQVVSSVQMLAPSPSCGGDKGSFEKAKPILQGMGKNIVHCGLRRSRASDQNL